MGSTSNVTDHKSQPCSLRTVRRIAIHQPNYVPWNGYFSKILCADAFVFLDNCQMPIGRSYVSRVKVRGTQGAEWMTVPVRRISGQLINAVRFAGHVWARAHLATLQANYGRCLYFDSVMEVVRPIYLDPGEYLAPFNMRLVRALTGYMGLAPCFHLASELRAAGTGTQRLIDIVHEVGGTAYVSGVGGLKYLEPAAFPAAGIQLEIRGYDPAQTRQQNENFMLGLSMLDTLFHFGPYAHKLLGYSSSFSDTGLQPSCCVT